MDIIFDLDGTLADITHRLHFIKDGNKDWDSFFKSCTEDEPIQPTIDVLNDLASIDDMEKNRIIICSGRSDVVRKETKVWLRKHQIYYKALYMRKEGNHQPDGTLKLRMYEELLKDGFNPKIAFDDRQRVVNVWRDLGLICYQVAKGDF